MTLAQRLFHLAHPHAEVPSIDESKEAKDRVEAKESEVRDIGDTLRAIRERNHLTERFFYKDRRI